MPVSENAPIIWAIATLATCGVILHPWRVPE
ncbi:hypothetical protein IWW33_004400 [Pseudomonas sp. BG2dil]|nr:hypothetical protein [Pseudomonas sp. M2]